jgi:hypothetical protein
MLNKAAKILPIGERAFEFPANRQPELLIKLFSIKRYLTKINLLQHSQHGSEALI